MSEQVSATAVVVGGECAEAYHAENKDQNRVNTRR